MGKEIWYCGNLPGGSSHIVLEGVSSRRKCPLCGSKYNGNYTSQSSIAADGSLYDHRNIYECVSYHGNDTFDDDTTDSD
jgi:hypothetical protein